MLLSSFKSICQPHWKGYAAFLVSKHLSPALEGLRSYLRIKISVARTRRVTLLSSYKNICCTPWKGYAALLFFFTLCLNQNIFLSLCVEIKYLFHFLRFFLSTKLDLKLGLVMIWRFSLGKFKGHLIDRYI